MSSSESKIQKRVLTEEMKESYLDYAMSVIVSRALPDVRDGLKPVHRRILHAMNEMGLSANARFRKSATVVGEVLGKYHPHGDTAVYDAMVRLAQDFSMRYPLIHGQGNFGSIDGDAAAAMRYTEAKMTKVANLMLGDINKNTVEWRDNYDVTRKEPVVLPAAVPQLLLNGTVGIAVGMATNIPPHNLTEVLDAAVYLIDHKKAGIEDLMQFVKGPDFPTGGIIYNRKAILEAYGQGKGPIVTRGKAEIKEPNTRETIKTTYIEITEIPYQVNKASLIERIAELVETDKLEGVRDVRDESDRSGLRIIIELKKDAQPQKVLNKLYNFTELQKTFHLNMLALVGGIQPQVLSIKEVLEKYLEHKYEVVRRRIAYDLEEAKARAHILEGLKKALDSIDKVIQIIKRSKDRIEAHANLRKKFKFSDRQATAILEMRLQSLANLERLKVEQELKEKRALIRELEGFLASSVKMWKKIKQELIDVKKEFGDERKTRVHATAAGIFSAEDLIPQEETTISMSRDGYIKRVPPSAYKVQHRGGKGIIGMETRGEDVVKQFLTASTHDRLLFFTNQGRIFQTLVYELPPSTRTGRGKALVNFLDLQNNEWVTNIVPLRKDEEAALKKSFLVMVTKKGVIKKTSMEDFENVRRNGLIALRLKKEDALSWVGISGGSDELMLVTRKGQSIRFSEKESRPMSRTASGVRGIHIKPDDEVVGSDVITSHDAAGDILIIMESGYGKRTSLSLFKPQRRGGSGVKAAHVTPKTGSIVSIQIVRDLEELIVMSAKGQVIRIVLKNVSKLGRIAQGVRIMKLASGDRVASITAV